MINWTGRVGSSRVVVDGGTLMGEGVSNSIFLQFGTFDVINGGVVNAGTFGLAAHVFPTPATVIVDGAGSQINASTGFFLGQYDSNNASLTVRNGGALAGHLSISTICMGGGKGTLNIGAAEVQGAVAVGIVNGPITFASNSSSLVYNHDSTGYRFSPPIFSGRSDISGEEENAGFETTGTLKFLSGATRLSADNSGFGGHVEIAKK